MNILLIAYYYPPIKSGGSVRPEKMAKYLSKFGHNVTILTQSYKRTDFGQENMIRIYDVSHNKDRKGINRIKWLFLRSFTEILNLFGIYYSIYSLWKRNVIKYEKKIIDKVNPDIIITTYPPVETLEIGLLFSKKYKIPLISDFRDGIIFEPIEKKRIKKHKCIRRKYEEIERKAAVQSGAIITIANPITDYFKKMYNTKSMTILTGFDPDDFENFPLDIKLDHSKFNIVFTGGFSLAEKFNRVDYFFESIRILIKKDPELIKRIRIHLIGDYTKKELNQLKDLIDKDIIVCHGFVERKIALAFQKEADILLIITLPDRKSSTSTKIFEYIYSKKPILGLTHKTVLADIIEDTKTGWVVHPQKSKEISNLIFDLVTKPDLCSSIIPDPKKIKNYSTESQLKNLDILLRNILDEYEKQ